MSILIIIKVIKIWKNLLLDFINKTPPTGKSIICIDNKILRKILNKIKNKNILHMEKMKKPIIKLKK